MKISNIKKFALPLVAAALLNACDKPETTPQLEDNGQKIIRIADYGGKDNYTNAAIILDYSSTAQTVDVRLEYLGPQVFDQDVTVTVGVDESIVTTWNADHPNDPAFLVLPAAYYTLNNASTVIKAGDVFSAPATITIDATLLDPAVSYMVPVKITSITGAPSDVKAASGTGIAYFHIFGNPLAGDYDALGYFYHPTGPRAIDRPKTLAPTSPTSLLVELGDLGGAGYFAILETDPTTNKVTISIAPGASGGSYTQFDDALPNSNPGYTTAPEGFAGPANFYDPATHKFYLRYGYEGANGWRVTEEILTKQ